MPEVAGGRADGVTVSATGRASAVPDVLVLGVAAQTQARDVGGALDSSSQAMAAMVQRLREEGLPDHDLRTSGVSLWSRTDDTGRVTWHTALQRLTATLRDVSIAGAVVPAVVAAGGDAARLEGLRFVLEDDTAVTRAARDDAWERARAVAHQHAEHAGRALGPVLRVTERPAEVGVPMVRAMAYATSAPEPMPVESGMQEVTVTIEVEWAFSA